MWKTAEFKVGFFVLLCIAIIAAMSFQVNNDPSIAGRSKAYDAMLPNANGIVKNSNVRMAGIPVGVIKDIVLDNGRARLKMNIRGDLPVYKDAHVEIKPNGILGDKYVELVTGTPETGPMPENSEIDKVIDRGSFDTVLAQVGKIASDISEMTDNLRKATTGDGDDKSPLGRIIHNVEDVTADLRDLTNENKDKINTIVDNVEKVSKSINEFVNDEGDDGFKTNWKKMAKSLGRVDSILKNVDEVTAKINQGKGTIGKLINDEQTVEELNHAISGVNNMLSSAEKFQVSVDFHSEALAGGPFVKSYAGIVIQPGPDRYYLIQAVDDPKGAYDRTNTQVVSGTTTTTTQTSNVYKNRMKLNAEFAKNFYDLTLRAGLIENTGGFGVDYSFLNKKLKVSAEAFAFGRPEGVDLRAYVKYKFYSVFYAIFGGDDLLNQGNAFTGTGAAGFVGAGLDFTNDDLKLLLTKVPF